MATRAVLHPFAAELPSSNPAAFALVNDRPCLEFDDTTAQGAYWTLVAPQGLSGTLTLILSFSMASATSGNIIMRGYVEAVSDGDALDLGTASSFDTANSSAATAVPGTVGYLKQVSITLTNQDSVAAADLLRIKLDRDAGNAGDTATGVLRLWQVELRDAA